MIFDKISGLLNKYDANGNFLGAFNFHDNSSGWPDGEIAIADSGEIAVGCDLVGSQLNINNAVYSIVLINSNMQEMSSAQIPETSGFLNEVFAIG